MSANWITKFPSKTRRDSEYLTRVFLAACALAYLALISGCTTSPSMPIITEEKDSGPPAPVDVSHISEPVPRVEPRTRAGNSNPYKVLGKTYYLVQDPAGYKEKGVASWYGRKFHGKRTANGEIYSMYGMTAAHRTLPIPSYVRVTNLKNNRSTIVRVNDRGPFHGNRIIDLTYAAAKKLGFEKLGTAEVLVEYIDPAAHGKTTVASTKEADVKVASLQNRAEQNRAEQNRAEPPAPAPTNPAGYEIPPNTFLQVGAFTLEKSALALRQKLSDLTAYPVVVRKPEVSTGTGDQFFRVRIGPLKDNLDLVLLRQKVLDASLPEPHVVYD